MSEADDDGGGGAATKAKLAARIPPGRSLAWLEGKLASDGEGLYVAGSSAEDYTSPAVKPDGTEAAISALTPEWLSEEAVLGLIIPELPPSRRAAEALMRYSTDCSPDASQVLRKAVSCGYLLLFNDRDKVHYDLDPSKGYPYIVWDGVQGVEVKGTKEKSTSMVYRSVDWLDGETRARVKNIRNRAGRAGNEEAKWTVNVHTRILLGGKIIRRFYEVEKRRDLTLPERRYAYLQYTYLLSENIREGQIRPVAFPRTTLPRPTVMDAFQAVAATGRPLGAALADAAIDNPAAVYPSAKQIADRQSKLRSAERKDPQNLNMPAPRDPRGKASSWSIDELVDIQVAHARWGTALEIGSSSASLFGKSAKKAAWEGLESNLRDCIDPDKDIEDGIDPDPDPDLDTEIDPENDPDAEARRQLQLQEEKESDILSEYFSGVGEAELPPDFDKYFVEAKKLEKAAPSTIRFVAMSRQSQSDIRRIWVYKTKHDAREPSPQVQAMKHHGSMDSTVAGSFYSTVLATKDLRFVENRTKMPMTVVLANLASTNVTGEDFDYLLSKACHRAGLHATDRPIFSGIRLDGSQAQLSSLRRNPLFVNMGIQQCERHASWCFQRELKKRGRKMWIRRVEFWALGRTVPGADVRIGGVVEMTTEQMENGGLQRAFDQLLAHLTLDSEDDDDVQRAARSFVGWMEKNHKQTLLMLAKDKGDSLLGSFGEMWKTTNLVERLQRREHALRGAHLGFPALCKSNLRQFRDQDNERILALFRRSTKIRLAPEYENLAPADMEGFDRKDIYDVVQNFWDFPPDHLFLMLRKDVRDDFLASALVGAGLEKEALVAHMATSLRHQRTGTWIKTDIQGGFAYNHVNKVTGASHSVVQTKRNATYIFSGLPSCSVYGCGSDKLPITRAVCTHTLSLVQTWPKPRQLEWVEAVVTRARAKSLHLAPADLMGGNPRHH